jgi:hypothetical protein
MLGADLRLGSEPFHSVRNFEWTAGNNLSFGATLKHRAAFLSVLRELRCVIE